MKFKHVFIFLTIFISLNLFGQYKETPFIQEYKIDYPFNNNENINVRTIVVDKSDNVWAGTADGLFTLNEKDKKWMPRLNEENQGPINDLFIDSKGELWIAAWNGLYHGNINNLKKIEEIKEPTVVVNKVNNQITAITISSIYTNHKSSWISEKLKTSRQIRAFIPDIKNGYYLATGKGLYHKTANELKLFQNEDELVSDNLFGIEFSQDGNLWIGGLGGVTVYKDDKRIKSYTPKDGIPNAWVKTVAKGPDGTMWIGTEFGIAKYDGKLWSVRNSNRWLINDKVNDIAFDKNGNAWIATDGGVSAIKNRQMTLAQKENYYKNITEKRHIREPYLVEKCRFLTPGDTNNYFPKDDDNDGQYTSMYLVMESLRYAVTKNPKAKQNAKKAFDALKFLQTVTETNGFFARTVVPSTWKTMADPNEIIDDREWAKRLVEEPRRSRLEEHWVLSKDKKWYWKRGTSSDEVTGHMYGYLYYYDLVADENEKEVVKNHITKIVNYIIDNGYVFVDIDGKHTQWGVWSPEFINNNQDWIVERGINSIEILSYLKLAYHVSGDEYYQKEYYKLLNDYNYKKNIIEPKSILPARRTYIDDELLALVYPVLIKYETDPELIELYKKSLDKWYDALKNDDNPYFYFKYNGLANNKLNLDRSIFLLQDNPLDLIRWTVDNSKREDISLTRKPIMEDLQTHKLVSPSERGIMRWDNNPWQAVQGDGGMTESDGVYWRLAYWLGRYHNLIQ
ncbi:MAG: regulator [Ignavibacteriales bacterium]|nr:regulator [Ignavibacteriales bacterium]